MAADYIKITRNDSNAPFAGEIISAVSALRDALQQLEKIQAKGFRMFASTDFTVFQTNYGIPTPNGQTVFDLVNGTVGALKGTLTNANALELLARVG